MASYTYKRETILCKHNFSGIEMTSTTCFFFGSILFFLCKNHHDFDKNQNDKTNQTQRLKQQK